MNEQILTKLVIQSSDKDGWLDRQKFAELIVRECIAECWYDATPKQISDNIKMKFGVE